MNSTLSFLSLMPFLGLEWVLLAMKKLLLMLAMLSLVFASCSKDDIGNKNDDSNMYTVKIGMGGELEFDYIPMTKATPSGAYGIQIYSLPKESSASEWEPYAFGIFQSIDNLTISLSGENKYKFVASLLVNGMSKGSFPFTQTFTLQGEDESITDYTVYTDKFFKSSQACISMNNSAVKLKDNRVYIRPNIDRYYGELVDYVPGSTNSTATVPMKRVSAGAKFVVEGVFATDGTLGIQIQNAPLMNLSLSSQTEISDIFSMGGITSAYKDTDANPHKETASVTLTLTKNGTTMQLGEHQMIFQRNTCTVVTIKMNTLNNGVGVSFDNSEIGDMSEPGDNDITIGE